MHALVDTLPPHDIDPIQCNGKTLALSKFPFFSPPSPRALCPQRPPVILNAIAEITVITNGNGTIIDSASATGCMHHPPSSRVSRIRKGRHGQCSRYCSRHQVDDFQRSGKRIQKWAKTWVVWSCTCQGKQPLNAVWWSRHTYRFLNQRTSSMLNQTDLYGHSLFWGAVCLLYS